MSYRIGSFNCLNLGRNAQKDFNIFVDIIIKEYFDIIALQEIKGKYALDLIKKRLPSHWDGRADTEVNDYAFCGIQRGYAWLKQKP